MVWVYRVLGLELIYLLQRILFFWFNQDAFSVVRGPDLFLATLDGLRFDLCAIATINVPLMALDWLRALSFFRRLNEGVRAFLKHLSYVLFLVANIPFLIFGFVDSQMYSFTGRRTTFESFAIGKDIADQSFGIVLQYWQISLISIFAFVVLGVLSFERKPLDQGSFFVWSTRNKILTGLLLLVGFLSIRGGIQTRPLAPTHAFRWQPTVLGNYVLNTTITMLRTPFSNGPQRINDFPSMTEVRSILELEGPPGTVPLAQGKNFVVIAVESLASEYVGYLNHGKGYTPFIDSLAEHSIIFSNSFASGRRSIDAIPAIFAGIPAWRDQPFITSPYAGNELKPLPRLLGELGYYSLFFHGASNGSMHFDTFSKLAGFNEYVGMNEYPETGQYDGQWGIFDEPFLKFSIEKLANTQEPFFAGIFTLSSHNPFRIPESEKGKYPKGTLPIHESIGYVDQALSTFFRLASSEPWFHNTIFLITGDHTSLSDQQEYNNFAGRFRVPILIFDPTGALPRIEVSKIATHADITPTILELVGKTPKVRGLFGGPLFDRSWSGRFVQEENGSWYLRDRERQYILGPDGHFRVFTADDDNWQKELSNKDDEESRRVMEILKATRQYYTNGLLDNNWYKER